jgi:hypothetical protein
LESVGEIGVVVELVAVVETVVVVELAAAPEIAPTLEQKYQVLLLLQTTVQTKLIQLTFANTAIEKSS